MTEQTTTEINRTKTRHLLLMAVGRGELDTLTKILWLPGYARNAIDAFEERGDCVINREVQPHRYELTEAGTALLDCWNEQFGDPR